jgi:hypothetical protein
LLWLLSEILRRDRLGRDDGAVARLVGIESGVVSGVRNLESPGLGVPGGRPRHENRYHET